MYMLIIPSPIFELTPAKLLEAQELAPGLVLLYLEKHRVTERIMAQTEIIYGCPEPSMLSDAAALKWHHLSNAGIEPYGDLRLYANKNVTLTKASGTYGITIAEHALGMTLSLLRMLPRYQNQQREHVWRRIQEKRELGGSTVLVLGMGDLGSQTAVRFRALGCYVIGMARSELPPRREASETISTEGLFHALSRADIIINCLPHTEHTEGIIGRVAFNAMKPGAVYINVGRGRTTDQAALTSALESGRLWGAGLDVTNPEPLPDESPLWDMENVIITPHSAEIGRASCRERV